MSPYCPVNDIQKEVDNAITKYLMYAGLDTDWKKLYYETLLYNRPMMISQIGKDYTIIFPDNSGGSYFLNTTRYLLKSGEEIKKLP